MQMERNFKRMLTKLNLKDEGDYIGNYKIPRKALVYGLVRCGLVLLIDP